MNLQALSDETLRGHAEATLADFRINEDKESDPTLSKWKRNKARKARRTAGGRLHRVITELDRRGLPRPWENEEDDVDLKAVFTE